MRSRARPARRRSTNRVSGGSSARQCNRWLGWACEPRRKRADCSGRNSRMIVATTENIAGHRTVQTLGQCFGVVVSSRGLGGTIMAGRPPLGGGSKQKYAGPRGGAPRHALDRLVENATAMGANAILMMRYDSAEIGQTMSEIVAYGTAAVIEPVS